MKVSVSTNIVLLEARVSQLGADAINLSIRIDARLDRQAERIDRVSKGLDQAAERLSQMIDAVDARLDAQAGTICKHDDRLDAQAIVVARRGEQIEAHDQRLEHHGKRCDMLHDGVCTINERLAIHVTRLDASASMHESAQMMRDMDHNRTDQLEARIAKLDGLEEKLADETFRLEGLIDDLERPTVERLVALESELEDTTRTANSAEMDVNDCKMDVSSLESSVDSLKSDLSSLSHTVNYG